MKLLLDENLSDRIILMIIDLYPINEAFRCALAAPINY